MGVDFFVCGSTLGNLLRFVRGPDRTFCMLAYKVHNTIFLLIPNVRGYGHTFPKANITWEHDVRGSASHQRLIRYDFGGLDLAVRFEADGYIKPPASNSTAPVSTASPDKCVSFSPSSVADLVSALSNTTIGITSSSPLSAPTSPTPSPMASLNIINRAGFLIPHAYVFDLKTGSIHTCNKRDHLAEELPRLWLSQIPTFILAFHTAGLFKKADTEIRDVRGDVGKWEKDHKRELARLAALLHWLRDVVVLREGEEKGRVEICCRSHGDRRENTLEVRMQLGDVWSVIPDEVRERWVGGDGAGTNDEGGEGGGKGDKVGEDEEA